MSIDGWMDKENITYVHIFLVSQTVKNLRAMRETWVQLLGWKNPLEKGMATHSSILAWKTPWTEEPGRLQSMRSQRVRHDCATNTYTHTRTHTHTYTYSRILFRHEKEWNFAICDNMYGSWECCAKSNKSDRERQIPYNLTYMWNLKQNENYAHRYREQIGSCQGHGFGGGRNGWQESKGTNFYFKQFQVV